MKWNDVLIEKIGSSAARLYTVPETWQSPKLNPACAAMPPRNGHKGLRLSRTSSELKTLFLKVIFIFEDISMKELILHNI